MFGIFERLPFALDVLAHDPSPRSGSHRPSSDAAAMSLGSAIEVVLVFAFQHSGPATSVIVQPYQLPETRRHKHWRKL